jgi:two-component system response regulator FixJ
MRVSLKRLLALSNWRVRAFESAEDFLADLDTLSHGCLVLDIQLGGMDGLELLRRLADKAAAWPVIVMSGSHDESAESDALRLGARIFLNKPFEPKQLLDAIAATVRPGCVQ